MFPRPVALLVIVYDRVTTSEMTGYSGNSFLENENEKFRIIVLVYLLANTQMKNEL